MARTEPVALPSAFLLPDRKPLTNDVGLASLIATEIAVPSKVRSASCVAQVSDVEGVTCKWIRFPRNGLTIPVLLSSLAGQQEDGQGMGACRKRTRHHSKHMPE